MKQVKLLFIITLFCATFTNLWAANLATWTFTSLTGGSGNWGPSPFAPTSSISNLTVVGLTRGSGVGATGTAAATAWGGTAFQDGLSGGSQTQATAIAANNYITFSFNANSGFNTSISDIAAYNIRISGTGPAFMIWQYSLNGTDFTDIGTAITIGGSSPNTGSAGNLMPAIPLSGVAALQNVASGTTITFRAVMWGAGTNTGTWYINGIGGGTFAVNGDVTTTPLSLDLISFKGQSEHNVNQLEWITADEKDMTRFELERGTDGRHFERIAVMNAKGNDKSANNHYTYRDAKATTTAYYRLLMVDMVGSATYSNVIMLHNDGKGTINVYPNPATTTLFLEGLSNNASYSITDVSGRMVSTTLINAEKAAASIDISSLSKGIYFLHVVDDGSNSTIKFIKK